MDFKCRCSSIDDLMKKPKGEAGNLSKTAMSMIEDWLTEQEYGIKKQIKSKYLEKGTEKQKEAIELVQQYLYEVKKMNLGLLFENKERKENQFLTGECDVHAEKYIIDTKCSWSCFTFPRYKTEPFEYVEQMQGYMELWDKPKAIIAYCLVDTPEKFIWQDAHNIANEKGHNVNDVFEDIKPNYLYSHLPITKRVKLFEVQRDKEFIQKVYRKVEEARKYIQELKQIS